MACIDVAAFDKQWQGMLINKHCTSTSLVHAHRHWRSINKQKHFIVFVIFHMFLTSRFFMSKFSASPEVKLIPVYCKSLYV